MQKHPFEWLPIQIQTRAFIVLLMLTLVIMGTLQVLLGVENSLWPVLALWCAIPKFIIVAMGVLYLAVSAVLLMIKKPKV